MRVLVVDDDPGVRESLRRSLAFDGYQVELAADGEEALRAISNDPPDAVVLDIMMPRLDGLATCRALRAAGNDLPILMLTARDEVEARVMGLDVGADDYLVKPFDLRELLARIRALARRGQRAPLPDSFLVGNLRFDVRARQVHVGEETLRLTTKEYALLEFFARRRGDVISRAEIAEHVWDDSYDPFSNVIDVYVQRLRRKLVEARATSGIETRRGEGYRLIVLGDGAS